MRLKVADARALADRVMRSLGHDPAEAGIIADHLVDCELRGLQYGGLARALSIAERLTRTGYRPQPLRIEKQTADPTPPRHPPPHLPSPPPPVKKKQPPPARPPAAPRPHDAPTPSPD